MFSLHAWQSSLTTSLQFLFGLPFGLGPSASYFLHFFTQSSSSFHSTCPYQCSLFCCNTNAISSIPSLSLSLSSLLGNPSQLNATHPPDHSHLCSLKCHHIFFPYRPGHTSMQHAASHTTTAQPSSHDQWYIVKRKSRRQKNKKFLNGKQSNTNPVGC